MSCKCGSSGPSGTIRCSLRQRPRSHPWLPEGNNNMADVTRAQVEDFLFEEADMLDKWQLPEWLELFTEDAEYQVPCMDLPADATPDHSLFYIADDRFRLGERVKRLMKRTAHVEFPHSKTRHMDRSVRDLSDQGRCHRPVFREQQLSADAGRRNVQD